MAAQDIRTEAGSWVADEIGKQCLGEDFGWSVTWAPVPAPGPAGPVAVAAWIAVITMRNPLLGQGELYHLAQLGAPRPREADVRREVADGLRQLRELAARQVRGSNGHARAAVPG
jgi:hypothetical protein